MNADDSAPYARDRTVDKPGIIGARWWHATLADQASQMARRDAIRNILIAGGVIAGFGAMLAMCVKAGASTPSSGVVGGPLPDDYAAVRKTALEMQKAYGWSFGAVGEPLVFDGVTTKPFEPGALHALARDLSPAQTSLKRFFQSTLFDSPDATPTSPSALDDAEDTAGFRPLAESVRPIFTPAMDAAYARGKSLASIFASLTEEGVTPASAKVALIVDLAGPEAVAFAAGASSIFDPVFLFDNWPHPRGVVRAQETLSAAAYYQPLFAQAKRGVTSQARTPMFVLDRRRLSPYTDDATQFDNRYIAKLPLTAAEMRALGTDHVLYVLPARAPTPFDLDDLNDELVVYAAGGIDVKAIQLDMFAADTTLDASDAGNVYYGGSRGSHHAFFLDYPWAKPAHPATSRPASNPGKSFTPVGRVTSYSVGNPNPKVRTKATPISFATVPVVVAVGTGIILGSRFSRSGSWNRSGSSWGGG